MGKHYPKAKVKRTSDSAKSSSWHFDRPSKFELVQSGKTRG